MAQIRFSFNFEWVQLEEKSLYIIGASFRRVLLGGLKRLANRKSIPLRSGISSQKLHIKTVKMFCMTTRFRWSNTAACAMLQYRSDGGGKKRPPPTTTHTQTCLITETSMVFYWGDAERVYSMFSYKRGGEILHNTYKR